MAALAEQLDSRQILERIADLAQEMDSDPRASELLDWIDAFHRQGIGRLVELARQWRGEIFIETLIADPVAGELLAAYGLGPDHDGAAAAAVQAALADVRPYLHSHGGDLEVASLSDGVVTLLRHGECDGCTAIDITLAERVDVALRRTWDDYCRIELVPTTAPAHPPPATGQVTVGLKIGRRPTGDGS